MACASSWAVAPKAVPTAAAVAGPRAFASAVSSSALVEKLSSAARAGSASHSGRRSSNASGPCVSSVWRRKAIPASDSRTATDTSQASGRSTSNTIPISTSVAARCRRPLKRALSRSCQGRRVAARTAPIRSGFQSGYATASRSATETKTSARWNTDFGRTLQP
jgi:hypothetical protein